MKWPIGKHNGRPIVGIGVDFKIRLDCWHIVPRVVRWDWRLRWLCFDATVFTVYGYAKSKD
jgi:hypothetical protein